MNLLCLGLNHNTAPVEVREKFSVPMELLGKESHELTRLEGVSEAVVVSTCNRTEVYVASGDTPLDIVESRVKQSLGVLGDEFFYKCESGGAIQHLCKVVSGLDSMVLGETEVFGQVKKAYQSALDYSATGGVLNTVFQKSFGIGKKVRTQTMIHSGQTSVGSVALDLAEKIFNDLSRCSVMMIGAGEMSKTIVHSMKLRGVKQIFVTNRSFEGAEKLAAEVDGEAVAFEQWDEVMSKVDVIISSTGATDPVVRTEHVLAVRKKRKYRPIFMIDIAMPRDIDQAVGELEEVYLYDLDTLQKQVNESVAKRAVLVSECEEIIDEEVRKIIQHEEKSSKQRKQLN